MKDILGYLKSHEQEFMSELFDYLRIPSISATDANKSDINKAAVFTEKLLKKAGLKNVRQYKTKGNPLVYGEWLGAKGKPTVLIYGHYDVQPPDPLDLWKTAPFEPTIRNGKLFARGAADDKGQVFLHFKAIEAWLKTRKELPLNVKVIVEGEEEIGSPSLGAFIRQQKKLLKCDAILISDTNMEGTNIPSICYSLRGLTYLEMKVTSTKGDLHSGMFGGAVANPIQVLSEILVACKDPKTGKVKIPGFYKDVLPLTKRERANLARVPHDEKKFLRDIGARKAFGEKGYTTLERIGARPTFEVNGIWGGFTGEGVKTVLPAHASAKVSMRLVANQDPNKIARLFMNYVKKIAPDTVKLEVKMYENNGDPALTPLDFPGMKAAANAIRKTFGKDPVFTREGGSIPIVADFQKHLKAYSVLMGFGLPDDNLHAPNEKMNISQIKKGMATIAYFLDDYAQMSASG